MGKKKTLQSKKKGKERKRCSYLLGFFLKRPPKMGFFKEEQKKVNN